MLEKLNFWGCLARWFRGCKPDEATSHGCGRAPGTHLDSLEAPESHVDSPGSSNGRPGRLQTAIWTAWEAQETDTEAPPFGEPGRLQMEYESYWAAREAAESHLDCPGNCRDRLGQPRRQQKGFRPPKPLHRASVREATEGFRPPKPWLRVSRQKWGLG